MPYGRTQKYYSGKHHTAKQFEDKDCNNVQILLLGSTLTEAAPRPNSEFKSSPSLQLGEQDKYGSKSYQPKDKRVKTDIQETTLTYAPQCQIALYCKARQLENIVSPTYKLLMKSNVIL